MPTAPFRVLVLCTGNSARSQMAEALFNTKGADRIVAESAGTEPAAHVNPFALEALRAAGIEWTEHSPRSVASLDRQHWNAVITVCDRAKESCPIFPGQPVMAHWSMPDPADVAGSITEKRQAFRDARQVLARRVDQMLALPLESLPPAVLQAELRRIGETL